MSDYAQAINQHYGHAELRAKILTAWREAGKDLATPTRDGLAPFDEYHRGGRETTRELARLIGLRTGMHVLAVGSGLGGRRPPADILERFGELCQASLWVSNPTWSMLDCVLADLRVRMHALASGGFGLWQTHPRLNWRSAYPSEVVMSGLLSDVL